MPLQRAGENLEVKHGGLKDAAVLIPKFGEPLKVICDWREV